MLSTHRGWTRSVVEVSVGKRQQVVVLMKTGSVPLCPLVPKLTLLKKLPDVVGKVTVK